MQHGFERHVLHTPMLSPEYMKVHYQYFPTDIRRLYHLDQKVHTDGYIYIKIKKGMYGLKQAAILAYEFLSSLLKDASYAPITGTLGLWKHSTRKTIFCLCVDDFGVKYFSEEDLTHLHQAISKKYTCKIDHQGRNFLGFTLNWNYDKGFVDISMPDYVKNALEKLQHKPQNFPQYTPHKFISINWTRKGDQQHTTQLDTSPFLEPKEIAYVQSVVGTFLYYARAIDSTMLPALNDIGSQQAHPTEKVKQKIQTLMDYAHTYPNIFLSTLR